VLNGSEAHRSSGDALHYRSAHPIKAGGLLLRLTLRSHSDLDDLAQKQKQP